MITVKQADELLQKCVVPQEKHLLPLMQCNGLFLREDVIADRCHPPYNRVAMDGIAVSDEALRKGRTKFCIEAIQAAGATPKSLKDSNGCLEVMTGAVLPFNCNIVIPYEKLIINNGVAKIKKAVSIKPFLNVHQEGTDYNQNDVLITKNTLLNMTHIAIAASVGYGQVQVSEVPKIAFISTGDEIIAIEEENPLPWQIRSSNASAIISDLHRLGFTESHYYHCLDDYNSLYELLVGLQKNYSFIILSGGVSMGKYDFVPKVLNNMKVTEVFHKIKQKPGKPLWFGINDNQRFFGVPGNPISALVCYRRYILPHIFASIGYDLPTEKVVLQDNYKTKNDFTLLQPVKVLLDNEGKKYARICQSNGSGDFASLALSDGIVEVSFKNKQCSKGTIVNYYPWSF